MGLELQLGHIAIGVVLEAAPIRQAGHRMGVAAIAIAVAHPAFGSQVAAQGVVAVALAVIAHAVETPAGGSAQQAVERIITKSLRLREAHLEILDREHVAGCAISITQILQRAGVSQRPAHQLLQSPALGSPGVIAILALRLVGPEYALGEASGCIVTRTRHIAILTCDALQQQALAVGIGHCFPQLAIVPSRILYPAQAVG